MASIMNYKDIQELERKLMEGMIDRAEYLMAIRSELVSDLRELDSRIDQLAEDMRSAGIDVKTDDFY
jgi:outer membrane murein-binding lipoprotein Lpp